MIRAGLSGFALALCLAMAGSGQAETLRIATWSVDLAASGPGLILSELQRGTSARSQALARVIAHLDADVLLLTDLDFDAEGRSLAALNSLLPPDRAYGLLLPLRGNTGLPSGRDLNGDGALNGPEDALAWGPFPGAGSMGLLSRLPLAMPPTDLSALLWADLPGNRMTESDPALRALLPLSRSGHWIIPLQDRGRVLTLMAYAATPPLPDRNGQRNIRRNHDETALWLRLLDGSLAAAAAAGAQPGGAEPPPPPAPPFVLLGKPNTDPQKGDGDPAAITALLQDPALQDPLPRGAAGTDTALFASVGALRVDMVLPSRDLQVIDSGVLAPSGGDPLSQALQAASNHYPVWVDLRN